jgi:hypothetical protein
MGADCFSPGHVSAPRLGVAVAEIAAALSRLAETPEPDVIRTRINSDLGQRSTSRGRPNAEQAGRARQQDAQEQQHRA